MRIYFIKKTGKDCCHHYRVNSYCFLPCNHIFNSIFRKIHHQVIYLMTFCDLTSSVIWSINSSISCFLRWIPFSSKILQILALMSEPFSGANNKPTAAPTAAPPRNANKTFRLFIEHCFFNVIYKYNKKDFRLLRPDSLFFSFSIHYVFYMLIILIKFISQISVSLFITTTKRANGKLMISSNIPFKTIILKTQ